VVGTEEAAVYFLRSDQTGVSYYLESRPRLVEDREVPVQVLQALIQQAPNGLERVDGITTFVPDEARLLGRPRLRGDVLEVNLSESFYDLQGDSSRYAFAQVVYTVTEIDGINEVRFLNEGRSFEVVDGAGQSRDRPVDREDYRNLEADE
jgi:spore germination protein GerM